MAKIFASCFLLLAGTAAYWLTRPGIRLFALLGIGNPHPLTVSGPLATFAAGHLADAAWCGASYLMAATLRESRAPQLYPRLLLVLPCASELAQAAGLLPGTFDWLDLAIYVALLQPYLIWEARTMNTSKAKHLIGIAALGTLVAGVLGSGTSPVIEWGTFYSQDKADDIFEKPTLARVMGGSSNHAVVLRVPAPGEKVTQEQQASHNKLYSTIDKELAKAGFIVRDRALFGKVLDQQGLDYAKIGQLTQTDIIIELVDYSTDRHSKVARCVDANGAPKTAPDVLYFASPAIEFKVISVKENDLVASYTFFHNPPCSGGCKDHYSLTDSSSWRIAYPSPDASDVYDDFAKRLIRQLTKR